MPLFKFAPVVACVAVLSACGPAGMQEAMQNGLRSGVALEEFAPGFPIGIAQQSDEIAASPATVSARLAQFARNCVDGRATQTQRETRMGMPVGGRLITKYRSRITNEDGAPRFIIAQELSGAVLNTSQPGAQGYNVQVSSKILSNGSGGTTLVTTRNRTFGDLSDVALGWAKGTSKSCPSVI